MLRPLALLAALALAAPAFAQAPATWHGTYTYTESIGTLSGVTATIDYRLTLSPTDCRIDAEGLQTDTHLRCTARPAGKNALQVDFLSHADGGMENEFGVSQYQRGAPLLRLERTQQGLRTHWQGFNLSDARPKAGRYLRKL